MVFGDQVTADVRCSRSVALAPKKRSRAVRAVTVVICSAWSSGRQQAVGPGLGAVHQPLGEGGQRIAGEPLSAVVL
jgi:hypothetical protein